MKLLIFILWCNLFALNGQTTGQVLDGFDYITYKPSGYDIIPCPWQSWRLLPALSFQIDVVVNDEELAVLQNENWLLSDALTTIYANYPVYWNQIELVRRFYPNNPERCLIHIPGLTVPYLKKWDMVNAKNVMIATPNPQWGWERRILKSGQAIAVQKITSGRFAGLWQVSAVMFVNSVN